MFKLLKRGFAVPAAFILSLLITATLGIQPMQSAQAEENFSTGTGISVFGTQDIASTSFVPLYLYVYAEAGETIDMGFGTHYTTGAAWEVHRNRAFYTITDPNGELVQTNDNPHGGPAPARELGASMLEPATQPDPISVTAATAGVYTITLRSNSAYRSSGFPWRVDVLDGDGDPILGRIWTDRYRMVEAWGNCGDSTFRDNNFAECLARSFNFPASMEGQGLDWRFYFISEVGYEYAVDYDGMVAWNANFEASLKGLANPDCTSMYKSIHQSQYTDPKCDGTYKLFFNEPANDLPESAKMASQSADVDNTSVGSVTEWIRPSLKEPEAKVLSFVQDDPSNPLVGTLTYSLENHVGEYKLLVDTNDNGSYDDPVDRAIPVVNLTDPSLQTLTVHYDGKDAFGNDLPPTQRVNFQIFIDETAEIHFVFQDLEQLKGGVTVTRLNGTSPELDKVYWDNSNFVGLGTCSEVYPGDGTDANNPEVNTDGISATIGGLHHWTTNTQNCRDHAVNGVENYGETRYIDTWTYAVADIQSNILYIGPSLSVAKTADDGGDTVAAGEEITYTVTAVNNGSVTLDPALGLPAVVVDDLSQVATIGDIDSANISATIDGVATTAPVLNADNKLVWEGLLDINEELVIKYTVDVTATAETTVNNAAYTLVDVGLIGTLAPMTTCPVQETIDTVNSYNCALYTVKAGGGVVAIVGPTANDQTLNIDVNTDGTFNVLGDLVTPGDSTDLVISFAGPTDAGDPNTITVPGEGVWTLNSATGVVVFTPETDYDAIVTAQSYTVTDGNGLTDTGELRIVIKSDAGTGDDDVPFNSTGLIATGPDSNTMSLMLIAGILLLLASLGFLGAYISQKPRKRKGL